ncbi:hypothetical protein EYZ11_001604 [Aspergillus tanneri]|uniref:Uncharacterized protein n=1 Tax=Aspergillus tanneri TaxID=1220188 RepID=A0A4S3JUB1_9EURO|nr:hypothetical protein EYZ11_001604 [Aspergillus tanneri]
MVLAFYTNLGAPKSTQAHNLETIRS